MSRKSSINKIKRSNVLSKNIESKLILLDCPQLTHIPREFVNLYHYNFQNCPNLQKIPLKYFNKLNLLNF